MKIEDAQLTKWNSVSQTENAAMQTSPNKLPGDHAGNMVHFYFYQTGKIVVIFELCVAKKVIKRIQLFPI